MEVKEIYWMAALLDGEGTFGISNTKSPTIRLVLTDKDLIERVSKFFKRPFYLDKRGGRKDMYSISICSTDAAGWMFTLYSLLSVRRQIRIREVIKEWVEHKSPQRHKAFISIINGNKICTLHGPVSGDNVIYYKRLTACKACYSGIN